MKAFLVTLALFLIPGVALAGGGGSVCAGFATGSTVAMLDSCFAGTAHFAPAGTELTVRNDGEFPHSLTAVEGEFDTGQLAPGETATLTVSAPGVYQIYCRLHGSVAGDGMAGVLIVGEPEPNPVAATFDPTAVEHAVAGQTQPLAEAVSRQAAAIERLEASQAKLQTRLDNPAVSTETDPGPTVVALTGSALDWLPLATGVAVGFGLAALLIVRRGAAASGARALKELPTEIDGRRGPAEPSPTSR